MVALDVIAMAITASRKIQGPRVTDLNGTVADYGTPLNYVYGTRRIEAACFYCEPVKEKKDTSKTKGGTYVEYLYYGTFAVVACDQLISRYSRIWMDRHLVYDVTGSGEEIQQPDDGSTLSQFMRTYLGTPDQPADPRMVAYITHKEGAGRTPAYLDVAYLMFEQLPLQFLGNHFPQVSVEVDGGGAGNAVIPGTPFTFTVEGSPTLFTDSMTEKNLGPFNFSIEVVAHDDLGNSDILDLNGQSNDPIITGSYGVDSWTTGDTVSYAVGDVTVAVTWYGDGGTRPAGSFDVEVTSERLLTFDPFIADTSGMTAGWVDPSAFGGGWPGVFPGDWDPLPAVNGNLLTSNAFYLTNYAEFPGPSWQKDFDINGPPAPTVVTLGAICSDVARRAGMAAGDYDFTPLDQVITGFSWTIAGAKQIVGPLLDLYDSDIFMHNFQLSGRKRGEEVDDGDQIETEFLIRERGSNANSASAPLYQITDESESDLPRRVFLTYADTTGGQQPNTAVSQRNVASTVTVREVPIDLTNLALDPDEAQPLAERWLRRQWMGGLSYEFITGPDEMAMECADLRTANLGEELLRGRLTRMTLRADRSIKTEWQVDGPAAIEAECNMVPFLRITVNQPMWNPDPGTVGQDQTTDGVTDAIWSAYLDIEDVVDPAVASDRGQWVRHWIGTGTLLRGDLLTYDYPSLVTSAEQLPSAFPVTGRIQSTVDGNVITVSKCDSITAVANFGPDGDDPAIWRDASLEVWATATGYWDQGTPGTAGTPVSPSPFTVELFSGGVWVAQTGQNDVHVNRDLSDIVTFVMEFDLT